MTILQEIKTLIIEHRDLHPNFIIVGDNSSGKSELLYLLLEEVKDKGSYYFIDSINRTVNKDIITETNLENSKYTSILKQRLEKDCFNLKDSFAFLGLGSGPVEQIYMNYHEEVAKLVKKFLGVKLKCEKIEDAMGNSRSSLSILFSEGEVQDDTQEMGKISSGYQAIIRIFLELVYFRDMAKSQQEPLYVIIDEINEFLSSRNEQKIVPFLKEEFPNINFIITTHSTEVVCSARDFNIIALTIYKGSNSDNQKVNYECLDANDFTTVTDVRELFLKIYGMDGNFGITEIETVLRKLLNSKIYNQWSQEEEDQLQSVKTKDLSRAEKLLIKQIESW